MFVHTHTARQFLLLQFDHDVDGGGGETQVVVSDKGVLLYNQALIHLRVSSK